MIRTFGAAFLCLALAACEPPRTPEAVEEAAPEAEAQAVPAEPIAPPRYVGLWAVDQRLCANPAWRFEADEISTLGEVHCDFDSVREVAGGYDIAATCTAEAPPEPYQLSLRLAESARGLTLSGGPWAGRSTSLVFCRGL